MIRTFTGLLIDPLNLQPEDVRIEDIAHHLSCVNRFNGALRVPIDVAHHSVWCSMLCLEHSRDVALQALLHDASEAYLSDVTRDLKNSPCFEAYREVEARTQAMIFERFRMSRDQDPRVDAVDRLLCDIEGTYGFDVWEPQAAHVIPTDGQREKLAVWLPPTDWRVSRAAFMRMFKSLNAGDA